MNKVYIVSGVRTPIGSFLGGLSSLTSPQLASLVIKEILNRVQLEDLQMIDEIIFGNVLQAGSGMNVARQAARNSGLPDKIPAFTVNKVCGSGLKAVVLGAQSIMLGDSNFVISGGTESMSNAPYILKNIRKGFKMGNVEIIDTMIYDGLWDAFYDCHMAMTAENIAKKYNISREEQDNFSYESQMKTAQAIKDKKFDEEIIPVKIQEKKGERIISSDEHPRPDTTLEGLKKLKPAFKQDGTITAGNASGINDGSACVVLCSEEAFKKIKKTDFIYEIISYASVGLDPAFMGLGPIYAIQSALKKANLQINDIDLFEINEAFAVQSLQVVRELNIPKERVNVNGGAIALGHPIGASGARILVTLMYEMKRRNAKYGVASLCIGGGQGIALVIKKV